MNESAARHRKPLSACALALLLACSSTEAEEIRIATPERAERVDFQTEVLPILRANCLACHSSSKSRGDVNLESVASVLTPGEEGPFVVPGSSAESRLIHVATHREKPIMPPKRNKVGARPLTGEELGLLARWIDEGAEESTGSAGTEAIEWRPLPASFRPTWAVAVSADGATIAMSHANRVELVEVSDGRSLGALVDPSLLPSDGAPSVHREIAHRDQVQALAFHPDGDLIASAGYGVVKLWRRPAARRRVPAGDTARGDAVKSAPLAELAGLPEWKESTTATWQLLTPDGSRRIVGLENGELRAIDAKTGKQLASSRPRRPEAARLARAERLLKLATDRVADHEAKVALLTKELETKRGEEKKALDTEAAARKTVETQTGELESAKKAETKKIQAIEKAIADAKKKLGPLESQTELARVATQRAEKNLADGRMRTRKARDQLGEPRRLVESRRLALENLRTAIVALAVSEEGQEIASLDASGRLTLHRAKDLAIIQSIETVVAAPERLVIHEDRVDVQDAQGLTSWSRDTHWRLEREIRSLGERQLFPDRVLSLAFDSEGRHLACGSGQPSRGGVVVVLDLGERARSEPRVVWLDDRRHSDAVYCVAFSATDEQLATGAADKLARVFDAETGELIRKLEGHSGHVLGLAWKSNQKVLVSAGADASLKVWNLEKGEAQRTIGGFGTQVVGVEFLGDGDSVVSASGDRTVRVHNTANGKEERRAKNADDYIYAIDATRDEQVVVFGGRSGKVRVWNAKTGKDLRELGAVEAP